MPEGDTIHFAARRIRPLVEGRIPEIEHPHPRLRGERWAEKLAGRAVTGVDAHGKHLFLRFEGDFAIHSHLRMTGSWGTYRRGERWRRGTHRAWLVLRTDAGEVVQFDGPVLELLTESRTRFDRRLAQLGPDVLAPQLDEAGFLRRLRADDPARAIGDALLDQRTIAGIGNVWKCEGCFAAQIDPWRPTGACSDDEALAIVRALRPGMAQSALDGMQDRHRRVYARAGRPCPRCGAPIRSRGQGEDNRITYWCAECQS
ncbi:MAG TPA: DNA-formamidopyrimidine glycosylase family protein [Solirubrobacteraceae bacterium]|jgi:endonuclease-8|nr:DNA-formamidopyrimidine glycosylase family protein [Solirubrobacteraceae bacterium]